MYKREKTKPKPVQNIAISPKHLLSQCIDLAKELLGSVIANYCENGRRESPFNVESADFNMLFSYIIDPIRFVSIIEHFEPSKDEHQSKKQFIKTWLFEMRNLRNAWAHWPTERIDYRMVSRGYDTLSLIYLGLNGKPSHAAFKKIESNRMGLLLMSIKEDEKKVQNVPKFQKM